MAKKGASSVATLERQLKKLTRELAEAQEQQAATAEILAVIRGSPRDIQPVFESILEHAVRLCDAALGTVGLYDGRQYRHVAQLGGSPEYAKWLFSGPFEPDPTYTIGRMIAERRSNHIDDYRQLPAYRARNPRAMVTADLGGARTFLAVPMLKDDKVIGGITIRRAEVRPFTQKQIHLVSTFANQAVIAIENVRLFNEVQQWNRTLEERVAEGVAQVERLGRLKRFFSPSLAELIVSGGADDPLRSHRREITVVFCDLRGYTNFTESAEPEDVMSLLREYHAAMGRLVLAHDGTLERFAGDGMMIFFNDPVPVPDAARRAADMALAMQREFTSLSGAWHKRGFELQMGIGIAQGHATLGGIGFEGRMDYAAIGSVCNMGARLCAEAKGGEILISQAVKAEIEGAFATEPVGTLQLKGFNRPVPAHRLLE